MSWPLQRGHEPCCGKVTTPQRRTCPPMSWGSSAGQVNRPVAIGTLLNEYPRCSAMPASCHLRLGSREMDRARRAAALREPLDEPGADRRRDPRRRALRAPRRAGAGRRQRHGRRRRRSGRAARCGGTASPPTPGAGRCRPGASTRARRPSEAAARETLEETGWRPGPLTHLVTLPPEQRPDRPAVPPLPGRRRRPTWASRPTGPRSSGSTWLDRRRARDRRRRRAGASTACRSRRCSGSWRLSAPADHRACRRTAA